MDFSAPPSAPSSIRVTGISSDAVTLAWEAPDYDGGSTVTGYFIERRDAAYGGWTTLANVHSSTHSYKAIRLLEGNEYFFRIVAQNKVGFGHGIETARAVTVKSPYGKYYTFCCRYNVSNCVSTHSHYEFRILSHLSQIPPMLLVTSRY